MKKLKVAVVNTTKNRGGAARAAVVLARAVSYYCEKVDIKMFHAEDNENDSFSTGVRKPLSNVINILLTRLLGSANVYDFGFVKQLKRYINSYDILHIHNIHGYYLNFIQLLQFWDDRPVVWTWHDMWGATGRCAYSRKCNLWQNGCHKCNHLGYYPAAWVDNAACEFRLKEKLYKTFLANVIIVTPSPWMNDIAVKRGFSPDRVITIPNAIDLEDFRVIDRNIACRKVGLDPDTHYLLFIAADCNDIRKGYNEFSDVVSLSGLQGIAVGLPPKFKKEGILHFGMVTSNEELCNYYNAVDAMVIPTEADNYPNTMRESMACGTPVFGYDSGGLVSLMPDWWDGLVATGDFNALAKKISMFIDEGGKSDLHIKKLREHAVKSWHPENVAEQYWRVYQRLMAEYENRSKVPSKGT